jgi:hypothetical protein
MLTYFSLWYMHRKTLVLDKFNIPSHKESTQHIWMFVISIPSNFKSIAVGYNSVSRYCNRYSPGTQCATDCPRPGRAAPVAAVSYRSGWTQVCLWGTPNPGSRLWKGRPLSAAPQDLYSGSLLQHSKAVFKCEWIVLYIYRRRLTCVPLMFHMFCCVSVQTKYLYTFQQTVFWKINHIQFKSNEIISKIFSH